MQGEAVCVVCPSCSDNSATVPELLSILNQTGFD